MPLPVLADTYQVRLNWTSTSAPRDASNNLYFHDDVGTQTEANLNTDINAAVLANMWTVVGSVAAVNLLTITKLDGTSAGQVFAQAAAAKWTGQGGTDLILQGAAVVSIKSSHRGPSGRGRIFLPWVAETNQQNGVLVAANVTLMQTAWDSFRASMVAAGWTPYQVSEAPPATFGRSATYTVRANMKTQRRRARR